MKALLKLLIIFISSVLTANSHAFPELPFCPGGGPPGWMNYFNDKRDQNIRRHYAPQYSPAFRQPSHYNSYYGYNPAARPDHNRPYRYPSTSYNYQQNHIKPGARLPTYNRSGTK